ncbi:Nickel uptake substrate-specific transmembrane region [Gimesia chilikensis]|uniref:Nickel uptake substrate-specific transmembrane region n=2 Tax=Gimesia chilikensis TaxID=2605989 RepID=A0A517PG46_9PLAN|nr:Nickel uptake substrate-specific transmembrane region [Gimesia chilikensis]
MWSPATPERHTKLRTESTSRMKYSKSVTWFFLLTALLAPVVLHAADADNQQQLTIKGVVIDEQNQPVPDAKVYVDHYQLGRDRMETRTDNQGKFALKATAARFSGQVLVVMSDSLMAQYLLPWQNIAADSSLQNLKLQVRPPKLVELEVVDQNEQPIAAAHAGIMDHDHAWGTGTTDEQGKIAFQVPYDVEIKFVGAISDDHGADYRAFTLDRDQSGDQLTKPPAFPDHPVRLKLDGTTPLKVKVQTPDGKPLAGIKVYPWLLNKPGEPRELNLGSLFYGNHLLEQTTDAEGITVFKWIPHWQKQQLVIWPHTEDYNNVRGTYHPATGKGLLTMELDQLVPISGQVRQADGTPAKGITVTAVGDGYQADTFRESVTTDDDGRYSLKVSPYMVYLVVAGNQTQASTPRTDFAVMPEQPVTDLDFKLRPATRLYGRVTLGPQRKPVAGQEIHIFHRGRGSVKLKEKQKPSIQARTFSALPNIVHRLTTDKNGTYEIFVGSGNFTVRGPSQTENQRFTIGQEREKEVNFHMERPEKGFLTGTVVTGNPPQPVPDARITGIYRSQKAGFGLQAVTDASGKFKVERELFNTLLCARTRDQKFAGLVEIGPDEKTVTIPLQLVGSVRGQLIDEENDQPLKNQELQYGVEIRMGKEFITYRNGFGETLHADAAGKFELKKLVVGQEYKLSIIIHPQDKPRSTLYRRVKVFTLTDSQQLDLGKLKVKPRYTPYKPPTIDERIAAAYDTKGTPEERYASAAKIARLTNQYLLILYGDRSSEAVRQFMTLRYNDKEIRNLMPSFRLLVSEEGEANTLSEKAREIQKNLGLESTAPQPGLFIFDAQSKQQAESSFAKLSTDGKINQEKLLKFLKANQYPIRDANELLETALKQAKEQNKRVIVQETATWCGPCRLLSLYLDRERKIWERDYIWIKLDHRWTGTHEIMKKLRNDAPGGIPWWAILDADGKILVTSNNDQDEDQNIGFPSSTSGREHYKKMLEKTAIRLNDTEINELVDALKQKDD